MFAVMIIQDFEVEPSPDNNLRLPFPISIDKGKMIGFLPIYETKEDAFADFPEAKLIEIVEANHEKDRVGTDK